MHYSIEAKVPAMPDEDIWESTHAWGSKWENMFRVPTEEWATEDELFSAASTSAAYFREFYKDVRIIRAASVFSREFEVVGECSFDFAHTSWWCGNSGCRES